MAWGQSEVLLVIYLQSERDILNIVLLPGLRQGTQFHQNCNQH